MTDLNKSPHSEHERKVQRLYEAAAAILRDFDREDIVTSNPWLGEKSERVVKNFAALSAALSAFDGKAFNEVKS